MDSEIQSYSTDCVDQKYGLPEEGTFFPQKDIDSLGRYAFLNEESIAEFLSDIQQNPQILETIESLIICQDYFYQNTDSWCDFQDSLSNLFTCIPTMVNINNIIIKLDIFSPSIATTFRAVNTSPSPFNSYISENSLPNCLYLLGIILRNRLNVKVNLTINLSMRLNTFHFLDSLPKLFSLSSLIIKCQFEDNIDITPRDQQKIIFAQMALNISQCQSLEELKIIVPSHNKLIAMAPNDSYSFEVEQLVMCISRSQKLRMVSFHLPAEFFMFDFMREKNQEEQTIQKTLRRLRSNKSIRQFDLKLQRIKNAPNMRRRTVQFNSLKQTLKGSVCGSLTRLVSYAS